MNDAEGSEYDRLFYPFLFEGGKASIEDVLVQVRHSTLEKCREVIELRRAESVPKPPLLMFPAPLDSRSSAVAASN